jgi:hypothetical protein
MIGMATFKPRLTKPEKGNKYYNTKSNGGFNPCIEGAPKDKGCNVLANCVGYAVGRFNEIGGYGYCKYLVSTNAENFIQYTNLTVGQTPKVGAVMVWQKGATLSGSDGAGHVSIVEKVYNDTEVLVSESGYGDYAFRTKRRKKETYGNWGAGNGYTFLGFIYNPAPCCNDNNQPEADEPTTQLKYKVGDIVDFSGNKQYENSITTVAKPCKAGKAKVTVIYTNGKHPYHLVAVQGGGSNVCGWVDADDIVDTEVETKADYAATITKSKAGRYRVNSSVGLHLRSGASTSKKSLEVMPNGSIVICQGGHTGDWLYVISASGKVGFCHSSYLNKI